MKLRILWSVMGLIAGILLSALIFFTGSNFVRNYGSPVTTLDPPAVVHEIQGLSELVTVKYTIQKVVGLEEKKVPVGSEKLLLIVQAEVLAGVDLSQVTAKDVEVAAGGKIKFKLPPPRIVHVVIDEKETKVWDRQITWWTPWVPYDKDLERRARIEARDAVERAAIESGILDQARRNAESGIRSLLTTLGVKEVLIY